MYGRDQTFEAAATRLRHVFAGRRPRPLDVESFRRAAVLVPILNRRDGPSVLFTRRTDEVRTHKGQISFPGGSLEPGEDARSAALREAMEEVALDPSAVEVVGQLDDLPSISAFTVSPVVGLVRDPPEAFRIQMTEVVEPFELPLSALLDRARFREEWWDSSRLPPGTPIEVMMKLRHDLEELDPKTGEYPVHFFDGGRNRLVWGLTGRILKDLLDLAFAFSDSD